VKLIQAGKLAVHGESNRTIILKLHVLKFSGELVGHAGDDQFARPQERPADINGTGHGRMPGDPALQIGVDERIEIQMRELQLHLAGPVTAQLHGAVNIKVGVVKVRTAAQNQISATCLAGNI